MGRIITPEEINSGHIPEPGAHQEAGRFLLHTLYDEGDYGRHSRFGNWGAKAIMIYGSTTTGTAGMRSDVDLIIQPFGSLSSPIIGTDALTPFPKALQTTTREFKVHPEPHYLPGGYGTSTAEHPLDPFYVDHLLHAQDDPEWSRNWPVELYQDSGTKSLSESQLLRAMRRYLGRKAQGFTEAIMYYDGTIQYDHLQRAFELPTAIGRKFVRMQTGSTEVSPLSTQLAIDNYVLSLASAETQWSEIAQHKELDNPFSTPRTDRITSLIALNNDYDELLADALSTGTMSAYASWLQAAYRPAIELAGRVAAECLEHVKHVPEQLSLPDIEAEIRYLDENTWDY